MSAMQQRATVPFTFNGLPLSAIPHENDLWLTGEDIGRALDYSEPRIAIHKIYTRNKIELDSHSTVLKLPVTGVQDGDLRNQTDYAGADSDHETSPAGTTQLRDVRVFSEEGVMILTMLSSQPAAAQFRAWAVRVLKAYRHGNLVIGNPGSRDRLLQTCIKEVRFGNPAAIHTLVHHFGYPESIAAPAVPNPFLKPRGGNASTATPLVQWFVDGFLPALKREVLAGGGPLLTAIHGRTATCRHWKIENDHEDVFSLLAELSEIRALAAEIGEAHGVDPTCTGMSFRHGLHHFTKRMAAHGWACTKARTTTDGVVLWALTLEGGE